MATITPATASGAVVALGGGIESLPILERIRALGHRMIVVDANPDAPGMALGDMRVLASCYDPGAVVAALESEFGGFTYDGVLAAATDTPHVVAAVAEWAGLPGLTLDQARLSVDKVDQWVALANAGLPVPDGTATFYGATEIPGYGRVLLDLNPYDLERMGDVVVKPADSRGGRGVQRLQFVPSPIDEHDPVWQACALARQFSTSGKLIGQKWLDGLQLSTESIIQGGQVLFTAVAVRNYGRLAEFAPYVIEDGCDAPYGNVEETAPGLYARRIDAAEMTGTVASLTLDLERECSELVKTACRALGWHQEGGGTVKGDLVIHNGRLHIIELAARLSGGFLCTHTIPLAYGVPFVDYAIRLALGETVEAPKAEHRQFVCQRYVFPDTSDVGRRVAGVYHVPTAAEFATLAVKPGDVIQPVTSHAARLGQAICVGATPDEARARAEQAVEAMRKGIVLE